MAIPLLPAPLRNLLADLERLPGVGPKSAQRMVFSLLHQSAGERGEFARDLLALSSTKTCRVCGMLSEEDLCTICRDPHRDKTMVCVVETPVDVIAIERTGEYHGLYHVLGGVLSPLEHIGPEHLNVTSLLQRLKKQHPAEAILALNPSTEGETTALYLEDQLAKLPVKITRIAQGLPTGAALEFADDLTIARALAGRREVTPRTVAAETRRKSTMEISA